MKVLLLNGSPHAKGCTWRALSEVEKTLQAEGIETELIQVGHRDIRGCISCDKCRELGHCVFNDIAVEIGEKFKAADGLVVGSPVYYGMANGTLTNLLCRMFFSSNYEKRMKVGAAVVTCRRSGNTATMDQLNKFFTINEMPVVSSQYWNNVHGFSAEDVEKDLEGLQTMRTLARNMAFMMRAIAVEKEKNGLPMEEAEHMFTSFPDGK